MKQLLCDGKPVYLNTQTGKVVTLVEDWQYKKELGLIDLLYIVPKGYQSDLTSIPKWIRWWGRRLLGENWNAATIAHDYIYQHQFIWVEYAQGDRNRQSMSKSSADLLFLELLEVLKADFISRNLMFMVIRLCRLLA